MLQKISMSSKCCSF